MLMRVAPLTGESCKMIRKIYRAWCFLLYAYTHVNNRNGGCRLLLELVVWATCTINCQAQWEVLWLVCLNSTSGQRHPCMTIATKKHCILFCWSLSFWFFGVGRSLQTTCSLSARKKRAERRMRTGDFSPKISKTGMTLESRTEVCLSFIAPSAVVITGGTPQLTRILW
jgi:hypothetical protein